MTPEGPDVDFKVELPVYNDQTEKSYQDTIGPTLTAAPTITHIINGDKPFSKQEIWGHNFSNITSVYLSGAQINALSGEHVDDFCSEFYPSFQGVPVQFEELDDNRIEIDMPDISDTNITEEHADVILVNPGGYGTSDHPLSIGNGTSIITTLHNSDDTSSS